MRQVVLRYNLKLLASSTAHFKVITLSRPELTKVVDNVRFAPLGTVRPWLFGSVTNRCVQQQVVDLVLADLLERLLSEGLDVPQVGKLQRQDRHAVLGRVDLEVVVGGLGLLGISGAKNDPIGLRGLEQLLDGFKTLYGRLMPRKSTVHTQQARFKARRKDTQ